MKCLIFIVIFFAANVKWGGRMMEQEIRKALDTLGVSRERKGFEQLVKGVAHMLRCDDWVFPPLLKDVCAAVAQVVDTSAKDVHINMGRCIERAGFFDGSRDFLIKIVRIVAKEGEQ